MHIMACRLPAVGYPPCSFGRRTQACTIRCGIAEPSGVPAPMGQKTRYNDGFFERAFMSLFARKMGKFGSGSGTS